MSPFARIAAAVVAGALVAGSVAAEEPAADPFPLVSGRLVLPRPIEFEADTAIWKADSEAGLEHARDFLRAHPEVSLLQLEAHVNAEPGDEQAQRTSEQRALAVARWLKGQGIDCLRLRPLGFGGVRPVATRETREGRQRNTRIDFVVVERRGRRAASDASPGGVEVTGACD